MGFEKFQKLALKAAIDALPEDTLSKKNKELILPNIDKLKSEDIKLLSQNLTTVMKNALSCSSDKNIKDFIGCLKKHIPPKKDGKKRKSHRRSNKSKSRRKSKSHGKKKRKSRS